MDNRVGRLMPRGDGIAIWRRIAADLRETIADGLPQGARLPPEAELARRFGVNRHTVRRALETLARDGLIQIRHGRGSFVTEPMLDYTLDLRPRFSEWIRRHNREPAGEKLGLRMLDPAQLPEAEAIAEALALPPGDPVIELERLGTADQRPVSLSRHIFPAARFPGLHAALRQHAGITEALAAIGIADYHRRRSRITCRRAAPRESVLLALEPETPLLASENFNVTASGDALELCFAVYPATRVALIVEPA